MGRLGKCWEKSNVDCKKKVLVGEKLGVLLGKTVKDRVLCFGKVNGGYLLLGKIGEWLGKIWGVVGKKMGNGLWGKLGSGCEKS